MWSQRFWTSLGRKLATVDEVLISVSTERQVCQDALLLHWYPLKAKNQQGMGKGNKSHPHSFLEQNKWAGGQLGLGGTGCFSCQNRPNCPYCPPIVFKWHSATGQWAPVVPHWATSNVLLFCFGHASLFKCLAHSLLQNLLKISGLGIYILYKFEKY